MRRLATLALGAIASLGLTACDNTHQAGSTASGNGSRCLPFAAASVNTTAPTAGAPPAYGQVAPAATAPPPTGDPAAAVEDCLHRWAYALAASTDDANQVATATVAACGPSIARWNQAAVANGEAGPETAPSLMTGQETTPLTEHFIFAQGRAIFYVVQARAGKCPAPPMTNGTPVGVLD
jgi:hypothetical protein